MTTCKMFAMVRITTIQPKETTRDKLRSRKKRRNI
jgi:hypothetical protein